MPDYSTIIAQAKTLAVDNPTVYDDQGLWLNWLNESAVEFQEGFDWPDNQSIWSISTTETFNYLGLKPVESATGRRWIRRTDNPYWQDVDGTIHMMEWIDSDAELVGEYPSQGSTSAETQAGQPKHIVERTTYFDVFPEPDTRSNGTDYPISMPYQTTQQKFGPASSTTTESNWISEKAPKFLVYKTASRALQYSGDDRWFETEQIAMREEKRLRRVAMRSTRNNDKRLRILVGAGTTYSRWKGR